MEYKNCIYRVHLAFPIYINQRHSIFMLNTHMSFFFESFTSHCIMNASIFTRTQINTGKNAHMYTNATFLPRGEITHISGNPRMQRSPSSSGRVALDIPGNPSGGAGPCCGVGGGGVDVGAKRGAERTRSAIYGWEHFILED